MPYTRIEPAAAGLFALGEKHEAHLKNSIADFFLWIVDDVIATVIAIPESGGGITPDAEFKRLLLKPFLPFVGGAAFITNESAFDGDGKFLFGIAEDRFDEIGEFALGHGFG